MEPFDTVSDTKDYLDSDPGPDEVQELLEAERDGPDRVTAIRIIEGYLDDIPSTDTREFRVDRPFGDHNTGDIIELDPDETQTEAWRRDGRISLH